MKLGKLSLAAAVALGTLTSASAKDLSEAIKGVDVSGILRYEFQETTNDKATTPAASTGSSVYNEDFEINVNFVAPIGEEITAHVWTELDTGVNSQNGGQTTFLSSGNSFGLDRMWAEYAPKQFPVKFMYGVQGFGFTDFSDDDLTANGLRAVYTPMKELALTAYFFQAHDSGGAGNIKSLNTDTDSGNSVQSQIEDEQLWGAIVDVNMDMFYARAQYMAVTEAVSIYQGKLGVTGKMDQFSYKVDGEYRASGMESDFEDLNPFYEDGTFWSLAASVGVEGWTVGGAFGMAEADEAANSTSGNTILALEPGCDECNKDQLIPEWLDLVVGEENKWVVYVATPKVYGFKPSFWYAEWQRDYEETTLETWVENEFQIALDYDFNKQFGVDTYYAFGTVDNENGSASSVESANYDQQTYEIEFDYKF